MKLLLPPAFYEYFGERYGSKYWYVKEWINKEEGEYIDNVGGYHCPCDCYNPKGYYCGECNKKTCLNCDIRHLEPGTEPYHFLAK